MSSNKKNINIISFNILHPDCAQHYKFPFCEPKYLKWNYRFKLIINKLRDSDADIICLQEMDATKSKELEQYMNNNYVIHYQLPKKMLKKLNQWYANGEEIENKPHTMCVATLFKRSKFTLLEKIVRSRTMMLSLLINKTNQSIIISNCHLEANPMKESVRMNQITSLFKHMINSNSYSNSNVKNIPIIVCGDFNCTSDSSVYHYMKTEQLMKNVKTGATYLASNNKVAIDFIYYRHLNLTNNRKNRRRRKTAKELCPNDIHPSDHQLIQAEFCINVDYICYFPYQLPCEQTTTTTNNNSHYISRLIEIHDDKPSEVHNNVYEYFDKYIDVHNNVYEYLDKQYLETHHNDTYEYLTNYMQVHNNIGCGFATPLLVY